jgi:hypothetical protein
LELVEPLAIIRTPLPRLSVVQVDRLAHRTLSLVAQRGLIPQAPEDLQSLAARVVVVVVAAQIRPTQVRDRRVDRLEATPLAAADQVVQ